MVVKRGGRIVYCPTAIVYDEKTSTGAAVQRQRTRWLKSYFDFITIVFSSIVASNFRPRNIVFWLTVATPPLVIQVVFQLLLFIAGFSAGLFAALVPPAVLILFTLFFVLLLQKEKADTAILKGLLKAPFFISRQILAIFQLKKASGSFLQTNNSLVIEIDSINHKKED